MAARGVPVVDADDIARDLMRVGTPVFAQVVEEFGRGILDDSGAIDRRRLGNLVFSDAGERERLNSIVHPDVRKGWQEWLSRRPAGTRAAAVIVPLLYEVGEGGGWGAVVCVSCRRKSQVERLRLRGLSHEEAEARINAQMGLAEKVEHADCVIINDGTKEMAKEQTERVLNRLLERQICQ